MPDLASEVLARVGEARRDLLVCTCGHSVERHPGTWLCTECPCIMLEPTATTAHFALGAYRAACPYCGAEPYHACHAKSDDGWPRPPHARRRAVQAVADDFS